MKFRHGILAVGITALAGITMTGCAVIHGPADRTDDFVVVGHDCTGSWSLGDLREGTDPEAQTVAELALAEADVTPETFASSVSLLELSKNEYEREQTSEVELHSEAYMLTVTLQVKDKLDAAGYPDIDRVIEVWSDHRCS
ncbi:hypothetical protein FHX48_001437 [Microbacterium halimionae]|uniref:Uncharacterized protein n=1 Tax=Microbacterium halimionae TaxID=1526413 RepID=A0A7W3JP48_9MICO|nr:hypothetical protein [Microbacterium halimionae]MBA8816364.1 hypothetical protein [Microbacterium halimionae]NII96566.1 hypothetical protein [Microbacterium halimionae]